MKRIFVPLDGSDFAESALPTASALAARFDAALDLASVVSDLPPVPLATGDGEMLTRWFAEEEGRAEAYLREHADRLGATELGEVNAHVKSGPVSRTLESIATKAGADLIVLTTHGRGAWQRAWLGSVADSLIRRSSHSLLLLRNKRSESAWEGGIPRKVVIPLDGSSQAEVAIERAQALLDPEVSEVSLVMVIHEPFPLATTYIPHAIEEGALMETRKEKAAAYLAKVAGPLGSYARNVETRVRVASDAGQGILDHLKETEADLVSVATRGRGGASRFILGSVADKVIRGATIPVLVSRRPGSNEEE